jgi:hypothetical protein
MNPTDSCGRAGLTVPLVSPLSISGPDINETLWIADSLVKVGRIPFGALSGFKAATLTIFVGIKPSFMIGPARGVPASSEKKSKNSKTAKP